MCDLTRGSLPAATAGMLIWGMLALGAAGANWHPKFTGSGAAGFAVAARAGQLRGHRPQPPAKSRARGYASIALPRPLPAPEAQNYLPALEGGVQHWRAFPLTVAFVGDTVCTPGRESAILEGFQEWETATNGATAFEVTRDLRHADVVVSCDPAAERSVTDTDYDPHTDVIMRAHVRIGLRSPDDPAAMVSLAEVRCLAAHEFGHALGINGHSRNPHDLMYPSVDSDRTVSVRDLNTLKAGYGGQF